MPQKNRKYCVNLSQNACNYCLDTYLYVYKISKDLAKIWQNASCLKMEFVVTEKGNRNSHILCLIQIFVTFTVIIMGRLSFPECLWHIIVCRWMNFMFSLQWDNPTCIPPKCGSLKMSNFDLYVMISGFRGILGDPKFGAIHVGLSYCIALAGYSWLTLVINSNNEVCSPSNNNVSKAFWN